jgi:hypothetical protein
MQNGIFQILSISMEDMMNNQNIITKLYRVGAISLVAFPLLLIVAFTLHFMGEFNFADFLVLKFTYVQPSPERFMEVLRSNSPMSFVLPHLILYLALPLAIPAVLYLGSFLFDKKLWLSITGISTSVIGIIYMGGVFGSWLSFSAIGNVNADQVAGAMPALAVMIKEQGMLMMTSMLAGLSLVGFMIIAAGLFYAHAIPRWQAALIFAGNLIIIVFMDIDNLMLAGATLWLIGTLPFLKILKTKKY